MLTTYGSDITALRDDAEDRWRRAAALAPPRENLDRPLVIDDELSIPTFDSFAPLSRAKGPAGLPPHLPQTLGRAASILGAAAGLLGCALAVAVAATLICGLLWVGLLIDVMLRP